MQSEFADPEQRWDDKKNTGIHRDSKMHETSTNPAAAFCDRAIYLSNLHVLRNVVKN